jgi:hypothetical protein
LDNPPPAAPPDVPAVVPLPARARVRLQSNNEDPDGNIAQLCTSLGIMSAFNENTMFSPAQKDMKKFASGDARQTLAFAREVSSRVAQNYRHSLLIGGNITHAHLLNFLGQFMEEQSLAQRAHEVLEKLLPSLVRYEQIRWAANQQDGRTPKQTAARVAYMVTNWCTTKMRFQSLRGSVHLWSAHALHTTLQMRLTSPLSRSTS